jgi:hypothetical protein
MTAPALPTAAPHAPAADPLLDLLERERAAFVAALARVPSGRRAARPAPDRWSPLEIAEHVARIDSGVARLLAARGAEAPAGEAAGGAPALPPDLAAQVRDRSVRIQAPEFVHPAGGLTAEAALGRLAESRAALVAAYRAARPEALDRVTHPHPLFGPVTLRGWVELAAHHDARHAQQVDEAGAGGA